VRNDTRALNNVVVNCQSPLLFLYSCFKHCVCEGWKTSARIYVYSGKATSPIGKARGDNLIDLIIERTIFRAFRMCVEQGLVYVTTMKEYSALKVKAL